MYTHVYNRVVELLKFVQRKKPRKGHRAKATPAIRMKI